MATRPLLPALLARTPSSYSDSSAANYPNRQAHLCSAFTGVHRSGPFCRLHAGTRRQLSRHYPLHDRLCFRLALPDFHDRETHIARLALGPTISTSVRLEFLEPELRVPLWRRRPAAAGMTVPEASVHKHDPFVASVRDVGRSRQVAVSHAIVVPHLRQYSTNGSLRLGVFLPYPPEPGGSLGVGLESGGGRRGCHT